MGQEGEWHCLVMEYVEGINLHKLITTYGAFSEVRAAHYIAQAAQGLQCIMQSGLVHRDLKPGNLLLTPDKPADAAKRLLELLADGRRRARLGANARALIEERYTPEVSAKALVARLRALAATSA